MTVERIAKIVGYLTLLGVISYLWVEIAGRARSELTKRIEEEVREA